MQIFALGDPHLSFGIDGKSMEVFGPSWKNFSSRIKENWIKHVTDEDIVLLPGDISWGKSWDEALVDLRWIDSLPGQKVISKGNHDYWWQSKTKMASAGLTSTHFICNDAITIKNITIGGTRLWDSTEYNFEPFIDFKDNPKVRKKTAEERQKEIDNIPKIFDKELHRLRLSLEKLDPNATIRIAMTHYPPISADLDDSLTSKLLEEFNIDICVFGHLHNVKPNALPFGEKNGVRYIFTASDYLQFIPLRIY